MANPPYFYRLIFNPLGICLNINHRDRATLLQHGNQPKEKGKLPPLKIVQCYNFLSRHR